MPERERHVGVTNCVDLRSICVTVRGEELHITKFRGCTLHPMCGFLDGQEVSAMQIGEAVRRMHAAVRSKMFSQMLKSKAVPDGFHEKAPPYIPIPRVNHFQLTCISFCALSLATLAMTFLWTCLRNST